ncbi:MAG: CHASE domain-containing protein [Planctomycetes bacterium]|nr:CHASE domain-containing protein [Planctomycetota bacterium]MCG2685426.1 CHASE domain-containing protein [Planctomycetales bacterium]
MVLPNSQQRRNGVQSAEGELSRSGRRRILFCLLVGLGGVVISLLLAQMLRDQERRLTAVQFQHDAERRIEAIQHAVFDRLSVVDIIEAFYAGSELVERKEFRTFTGPLLQRFQGVRVLGWAPLIAEAERTAHEQAVREDGFSNYGITEQDDRGRYVPAVKRAEYCPVLFVEPFEKYKSTLGFDLRSDPACRAATERAMATGRQAAAVCSPAGKDTTHDKLLYVVAPIRNADASADRPQTAGFVFGVFDISAIVEAALHSFTPVGIDVNIRDLSDAGSGPPICTRPSPLRAPGKATNPAPDPAKPSAAGMRVTGIIEAVDRMGEIECVPLESYLARHRTWGPTLVLPTGLLITALLVGLLFLLTGRTARVRRLVTQRTQELRASEQRFRRLVDSAGDAFFLHDLSGRILDLNKRACNTLGYSRDELLDMNISEIDAHFIDGNQLQFWNLPDNKYPVSFGGIHLRKDGSTFPVEIRLVPFNVGNERLMLGLARDITDRKLAEEKLRKEQRLLREMLDLQEQDRKLVSYEIHDGLAQQLTGVLFKFQSIENLQDRDPDAAREMFDEAVRLLREAMAETRRLIGGLRPPVLDESGIVAAVEDLLSGYRQHDGPKIEFVHNLEPRRFAPPLESAVFRVVQESLTNACRHSRSEKVRVELGLSGDRVLIDVRDWGVGFDTEKVQSGHFGLRGLRERARLLGGSAEIESSPEYGTHVHVELPLSPPVENGTASGSRH